MSMSEFVEKFYMCLTYFRFTKVEVDFEFNYGDIIL